MAPPCLYLNIDNTGICAAVSSSGSREIFTIKYKDLPDLNGAKANFSSAMDVLAEKTDLSLCRFALVLIPPAWICFRHTHLPFSHENRIRQVLPLELASGLPDPGESFLLDFCVVDVGFKTDQHLILSGTMPEEKMEEIFNVLTAMKISLKQVSPRGYAQAMAFLDNHPQLTDFIYVHWASTDTTLTLVMNQSPLVVRSLSCDYLPFPDMENWDAKGLGKEIIRTLVGAGIQAGLKKETLSKLTIVLCASNQDVGEAQAEKIIDRLNRETASFFQGDPVSMDLQDTFSWTSAITPTHQPPFLFNFCKGRFKTDSFLTQYKIYIINCLILLLISFSLGVINLHLESKALEAQVARLRQTSMEIYRSTFPEAGESTIHAPLLLMKSKIKQAKKDLSRDGGEDSWSGVNVLDILDDISVRIPASIDIEITRLVLNHGRLILTGSTDNFNEVDTIKGRLQSSPKFKNVTINSAEADKNGNRVRFKFILEI